MVQWREIGSRAAARTRDVANLLTTPLLPDDLLGTLNPVWSTTEPAGRVVEVRRETADTSTLLIRTGPRRPQHRAGQYVGIGARLDGVLALAHLLGDVAAATTGCSPSPSPRCRTGSCRARLRTPPRRDRSLRLGPPAGDFVLPEPVPGEAAVRHGRQRRHSSDGDAAAPRRPPAGRARRTPSRCTATGPRTTSSSAPSCAALAAATGLRLVERHTAARRPAHPGRARLARARLGRAAGLGVRPGRPARRPGRLVGPPRRRGSRCTSSGSSPPRPAAARGHRRPRGFTASKSRPTPPAASR